MNRRGFLGLLSKLVTVGSALAVAPEILAPLKAAVEPEERVWTKEEMEMYLELVRNNKPTFALAS